MTENHSQSHFSPFQINTLFFSPKITFDRISRHFRSIRKFCCWFFSQNGCRRPFCMTETHFRSHFSPFQINAQLFYFFSQKGYRRPFWMTENHFRSHFSLFQINAQLFFFWFCFSKWPPAAILDDRKSLLIALLAISDQCATFVFWNYFQIGRRFAPKIIGFFHYVLSMAMPNMKLIGELMTPLEMPHFYTKWPPEAILFFWLMPKIIRFL